jgi:hypothetical protein
MVSSTTYTGNYIFSDNGVIVPDTSEILETVQNEYRAALGQDLSLEPSTPQGRLIDTEVQARQAAINFNATIANVLINIIMSSGSALDAWGANFDVYRNGATSSRVTVIVGGVPDTVIPAGSQAATESGTIWTAESEIIISDNGTAEGVFLCSQTGAVSLGAGELNTIVSGSTTGLNGWETITNPVVAELGSAKESDASFKSRILNSLFSGSALFGNYASACYKVENVKDVYAFDNPYDRAIQLDNISVKKHGVYVCVEGGNSEDVAYALYSIKSAGANWTGNTTVSVIDKEYNSKNSVTYQIPESVPIKISVDLTTDTNSDSNLTETVQNTIINYASGLYSDYKKLGIRALIAPFTIGSVLNSQIQGINVNKIEVGLLTPALHAVASIIKASVTSGIIWASVNSETFGAKVEQNGTYNFIYDGENWKLNTETVNLSDYGIEVTTAENQDLITNDTVSIVYADGNMSTFPINLFASETAQILAENIQVTING